MRLFSDARPPRDVDVNVVTEPARERERPLLTLTWFGLLTGWLELGLVLSRRALDPRISMEMLRTNRHFVWMVPVSDALIFAAVGLCLVPLARSRPRLARSVALRLAISLGIAALLLNVEGLYPMAGVILACGLGAVIGPWLGRRASGFGRLVRVSFPAMAVGLVVLTGLTYGRIASAERRALSLLPAAKPGAPNVLLIVLDDVRAASLSLYGHDRPTTPNLEWLARNGVVFTEARSTAPWTLPTHASMFTGRWPHELSVGRDLPLDRTFPTLAETLAREGYATAGFVGNTYYCNVLYGLNRGFARYEDAYETRTVSLFETIRSSGLGRRIVQLLGYPIWVAEGQAWVRKSAEMLNRDVLGWLAKRPAGRPFFAFINYYDAHAPFLPPEGSEPRFGQAALSLADRLAIDGRYLDLQAGKPSPSGRTLEQIAGEAIGMYRDCYESCIAYLDYQVGLLLNELERRGALENTLVIVTSDHGEHFGEHRLLGHALSLYRREVHVPLLLIPPSRSSAGKVVDEPVSLRDLPATVAEWVNLGPRNPFPGRSLTRTLSGRRKRTSESSPILSEVQHFENFRREDGIPSSLGPAASLLEGELVYIRGAGGREEFYDLATDPLESEDLAHDPRSRRVIDRFRQKLTRLSRESSAPVR